MKDIKGWEGKYAITKDGKVWSYPKLKNHRKGLWLKPRTVLLTGYLTVDFYNKQQQMHFKVHRLVASTFLPNPMNHQYINHKNGIKRESVFERKEER